MAAQWMLRHCLSWWGFSDSWVWRLPLVWNWHFLLMNLNCRSRWISDLSNFWWMCTCLWQEWDTSKNWTKAKCGTCPDCHSIVSFQVNSEEFVKFCHAIDHKPSCEFFRVGESSAVQNAKVELKIVCYVMQDFAVLHLQYLYGKPFFWMITIKRWSKSLQKSLVIRPGFHGWWKRLGVCLRTTQHTTVKKGLCVFDRLSFSGTMNPVVLYSNIRKQHSPLAKVWYSNKVVGDILARNKNNRYKMAHIGAMIPVCKYFATTLEESDAWRCNPWLSLHWGNLWSTLYLRGLFFDYGKVCRNGYLWCVPHDLEWSKEK